jgi:hypothetical protein
MVGKPDVSPKVQQLLSRRRDATLRLVRELRVARGGLRTESPPAQAAKGCAIIPSECILEPRWLATAGARFAGHWGLGRIVARTHETPRKPPQPDPISITVRGRLSLVASQQSKGDRTCLATSASDGKQRSYAFVASRRVASRCGQELRSRLPNTKPNSPSRATPLSRCTAPTRSTMWFPDVIDLGVPSVICRTL